MDELLCFCDVYGVCLIEDAVEFLGLIYKGRQSGMFGCFGIYFFNGNKIIIILGGGMFVFDDEAVIEKVKFFVLQVRDVVVYYQYSEFGYNYRFSNIFVGVGILQLEVFEECVWVRREIFYRYKEVLEMYLGICMMLEFEGMVLN